MLRRTLPAFLAVCLLTTSAFAQDLSSPKATFKTFFTAMQDGNRETAKATVMADEDQQKFADMMIDIAMPMMQLEKAMQAKFGKGMQGPDEPGLPTAETIDAADVTIDGDTATLTVAGQEEPATLKKVGDEWKLDFSKELGSVEMATIEAQKPMLNAMKAAAATTTKEVNDGKYATAEEAVAALQSNMQNAMLGAAAGQEAPATDDIEEPAPAGGM